MLDEFELGRTGSQKDVLALAVPNVLHIAYQVANAAFSTGKVLAATLLVESSTLHSSIINGVTYWWQGWWVSTWRVRAGHTTGSTSEWSSNPAVLEGVLGQRSVAHEAADGACSEVDPRLTLPPEASAVEVAIRVIVSAFAKVWACDRSSAQPVTIRCAISRTPVGEGCITAVQPIWVVLTHPVFNQLWFIFLSLGHYSAIVHCTCRCWWQKPSAQSSKTGHLPI